MRRIEGGNKVQKTPLFVRLDRFNILWCWILTTLFQALILASLYLDGETPKCTLKHSVTLGRVRLTGGLKEV